MNVDSAMHGDLGKTGPLNGLSSCLMKYCIAVATQSLDAGILTNLKVYPTLSEFLDEHGSFADEREIEEITMELEDSRAGELGMLDILNQPEYRFFYMVGVNPRETQDALRHAVYQRYPT